MYIWNNIFDQISEHFMVQLSICMDLGLPSPSLSLVFRFNELNIFGL